LLTGWNIGTASYVVKRIGRIRSSGLAESGVQELQEFRSYRTLGLKEREAPFGVDKEQ
jgi:hypothetical protein